MQLNRLLKLGIISTIQLIYINFTTYNKKLQNEFKLFSFNEDESNLKPLP